MILVLAPLPLAEALARGLAAAGLEVVVDTDVDLGSMRAVRAAVAARRPEVVVLIAPLLDAEIAEAEPDRAFRANAEGAINLAAAALEFAALPVLISSAEVFGQRGGPFGESDAPEPASALAESLLRAEKFLARAAKEHLILRAGALLDEGLEAERARLAGGPVFEADDEVVSVTFADPLGRALAALLAARVRGVVHVAQPGPEVTRAALLQRIALALGLPPASVVGRPGRSLERRAARARRALLFTDRLARVMPAGLPSWERSLLERAQALAPSSSAEAPGAIGPSAALRGAPGVPPAAAPPELPPRSSASAGASSDAAIPGGPAPAVRLLRAELDRTADGERRRFSTRVGLVTAQRIEAGRALALDGPLELLVLSGKALLEVGGEDHVLRAGQGAALDAGLSARAVAIDPLDVVLLQPAEERA